MKNIILPILYLLLMASNANAAEASFQWTAQPDATWGTKIYIGTEPGVYSNSEDAGVGTTNYTVDDLLPGTTYYFTATHYDTYGNESVYAAEVSTATSTIGFNPLPPIPDSGVKEYVITISIPD